MLGVRAQHGLGHRKGSFVGGRSIGLTRRPSRAALATRAVSPQLFEHVVPEPQDVGELGERPVAGVPPGELVQA
ncbi:hypothetical protein GCM10010151_31860 [Actinoallomurus spadix]|uniref:Uncharacterized protein n=1 Tax=Actinoallomurus spadix TaxID=79912 RepID=A0ABN0WK39_9ACTN